MSGVSAANQNDPSQAAIHYIHSRVRGRSDSLGLHAAPRPEQQSKPGGLTSKQPVGAT